MPILDLVPDNLNDDPNYDYQLTSHLDQSNLKDARTAAIKNIANAGSSVPQASTLRAGNTTVRATPATVLTTRQGNDLSVKRVDMPLTKTVAVSGTVSVAAVVTPSWATNKAVAYVSSVPAKATVNSSTGLVTGVAAGTTVITGTSSDGSFVKTTTVTVA